MRADHDALASSVAERRTRAFGTWRGCFSLASTAERYAVRGARHLGVTFQRWTVLEAAMFPSTCTPLAKHDVRLLTLTQ
jgi:hypothetical protein